MLEEVSRRRPEAAHTLRRRACKALDQLAAYVEARLDDDRLAARREAHPWVPPTWRELVESEAEVA